MYPLAVGLIIGGAVGNLARPPVPRRRAGSAAAVVDFIDVQWWPIFNVADIAVTVGGALLLVLSTLRPPARAVDAGRRRPTVDADR